MGYAELLKILDFFQEWAETLYEEAVIVKAMVAEAEKRELRLDFDELLKGVHTQDHCGQMLIDMNVIVLKMKTELLEKGIVLTGEDFLKWLIEIKVSKI